MGAQEVCLNKFFIVLVGAFVLLLTSPACGILPGQGEPTATPTRRAPRPTFTPRAVTTPTEEIQPTDEPTRTDTPEPEPTDEPTPVPVTKAPTKRPVAQQPKPTTPPQPPPKPKLPISVTSEFMCEQDGIYEVVVSVKQGRALIEGVVFAAFDAGGRLLQDGAGKNLITATYPVSQSTAGNCRLSGSYDSPVINNGKLDVGDAVRAGANPVVVRFVKSQDDLTPLSPDIRIDFGKGGRYWIYTQQ